MTAFDVIVQAVEHFPVLTERRESELIITNRANGNRLFVYEETTCNGRYTEYIVAFATQHCHFDDGEDTVDYVLSILNDEVLPIEFYRDGKAIFGGELNRKERETLSAAALTKKYGFVCQSLSDVEFEVFSWSGKYDVKRQAVGDCE